MVMVPLVNNLCVAAVRCCSGRENMIGLAIARTIYPKVGSVHVHRVPAVAGIYPAPVYRYARWVGQMLGVGPRLSIDHRNHVREWGLTSDSGQVGSAPPNSQHKNPVWRNLPRRIDHERPRKLTVFSNRTTGVAQFSTGACVILIRTRSTCRELQFSRFLGRDFHNGFCISRMLMQAVH